MTTKTYRNDTTGYRVTLIDNGRGARVTDSLGYDFPMVGADYPHAATLAKSRAHNNGAVEVPQVGWPTPCQHGDYNCLLCDAPAQMASPLPAELQVRSSRPLADGGGSADIPTLPQARCLSWAATFAREVRRGNASVDGRTAPMPVLVAMARRGWLDLDHSIRPTYGEITATGRRALAAYVAKHGEVL